MTGILQPAVVLVGLLGQVQMDLVLDDRTLLTSELAISGEVVDVVAGVGDSLGVFYGISSTDQSIWAIESADSLLWKVGGLGQGPGEYQVPSHLSWQADTLVVSDLAMQRASLVGTDGRFVRWVSVGQRGGFGVFVPSVVGLLEGGSAIVVGLPPSALVLSGEVRVRPVWVVPNGDGGTRHIVSVDARGAYFGLITGDGRAIQGRHPLASGSLIAIDPPRSRIIVVDRDVPAGEVSQLVTIRYIDMAGDTSLVRQLSVSPPYVGSERRAAFIEEVSDRMIASEPPIFASRAAARGALAGSLADAKRGRSPAVDTVLVGNGGEVWLGRQGYSVLMREWIRVEPKGPPRGFSIPANEHVIAVADPFLWTVHTDPIGRQFLIRYRIEERESGVLEEVPGAAPVTPSLWKIRFGRLRGTVVKMPLTPPEQIGEWGAVGWDPEHFPICLGLGGMVREGDSTFLASAVRSLARDLGGTVIAPADGCSSNGSDSGGSRIVIALVEEAPFPNGVRRSVVATSSRDATCHSWVAHRCWLSLAAGGTIRIHRTNTSMMARSLAHEVFHLLGLRDSCSGSSIMLTACDETVGVGAAAEKVDGWTVEDLAYAEMNQWLAARRLNSLSGRGRE